MATGQMSIIEGKNHWETDETLSISSVRGGIKRMRRMLFSFFLDELLEQHYSVFSSKIERVKA